MSLAEKYDRVAEGFSDSEYAAAPARRQLPLALGYLVADEALGLFDALPL